MNLLSVIKFISQTYMSNKMKIKIKIHKLIGKEAK